MHLKGALNPKISRQEYALAVLIFISHKKQVEISGLASVDE